MRGKVVGLARKHSSLLERLPKVSDFGPFVRAAAFLTVTDYLICIDDVERRSESLPLRDVLGLLTMLREERGCRVLVVLNTDALSDRDKADFESFREKVFDYEIVFAPTPEDCAELVFKQGSHRHELAARYAVQLRISNIRVLYRIRRLIDTIVEFAPATDERVQEHIVRSAVLLAWCFYTRTGEAPAYEYVKRWSYARILILDKPQEKPAQEKQWDQLMSSYGYQNTGELEEALCDVLERGYVDSTVLHGILADRVEATRRSRLEEAFHEAWSIYHQGFDPDPTELVSAFEASIRQGAEVIIIENASAATRVLRELGYDDLADELMFHWIHTHARLNPRVLDMENHSWSQEIRDPRFREEAHAAFVRVVKESKHLAEVAVSLSRQNGWGEEDIHVLASASEDDYYRFFKSLTGENTRSVVNVCLRFGENADSSPRYRVIAERARGALNRIAKESKLNKLRVESYGISLQEAENN